MSRAAAPSKSRVLVGGVPGSGAWAHLGLSLLSGPVPFWGPKRASSLVVVRKSEEDLEDVADAMEALKEFFPGVSASKEPPAFFGEDERGRLASLEKLSKGCRVSLVLSRVLDSSAPSRRGFSAQRFSLRMGSTIPHAELVSRLAALGYQRSHFAEGPGEFAVRGAVVDVHAVEPPLAARLLFNGNTIESLRSFDPETQSSGNFLDEVALSPVASAGSGEREPLLAWLPSDAAWVVEEQVPLPDSISHLAVGSFPQPDFDYGARPAPRFQGNLDLACAEIASWRKEGYRVLFYSLNRGEEERVQELLEGRLKADDCRFLIGPLRSGFVHPGLKLAVVASSELFERSYRSSRPWKPAVLGARGRARISDLKPGDYVIHRLYGVGRYRGIKVVESEGKGAADCLLVEYRNEDKLYVPLHDFQMVQRYVGAEGHKPRLSSLDTRSWDDVKEKVRAGVREMAERILKLEAARAAHPGHAFGPDGHLEAEFAASFPYEETPDQRRAIDEVKADMMSPRSMDRLVAGDVGYGKTEVAMRAAMKCAAAAKQTCVLVPTTILADQHYRTFSRRFAEYPVKIAMLSRFQTAGEQKKVLEDLRAGRVDVVIGTHRLLSPDVTFKDLGLLVIDEEHRFGVKDKEKVKALRSDVDVLSLSATPIPRTLYQAMSGLRHLSLIQSAPVGRQPVVTKVGPWSEAAVAGAVREEMARGGQVYYVHNRVRGLPEKVSELKKLLPGVRFGMAHGQMAAAPLEKTMWAFFNREFDVLVASSIIESGLDIPTVNTLLVEDAQDFGLAQLYQLRGRIGRERKRAFCYLFYPKGVRNVEDLPEEARQRLSALREFADLGSGFKLAMRDLDIRGAGDLLGAKQHGFINAVGFEFYCQLLQQEIAALRGKPLAPEKPPVHLDLGIAAYIPESYLPGELERLEFYKRLLAADLADLPALKSELEDLSGPAPEPVAALFRVMEVRAAASRAGVRDAVRRGGSMEIRFAHGAPIPPEAITAWQKRYAGRIEFLRELEGEGEGIRVRGAEGDPVAWLKEFLGSIA